MRPLKILLDAQLTPHLNGGIEPLLVALVHELGKLTDGEEEYRIITHSQHREWLAPFLGPNQQLISPPSSRVPRSEKVKRTLGPMRQPLGKLWRTARRSVQPSRTPYIPESDGWYESLHADVLHFPYPMHFILTQVPTIFSIYDLNHRHLKTISQAHTRWREALYAAAFAHARAITTLSQWVRRDVQMQYHVAPEKIFAIRAAPPSAVLPVTSATVERVRAKYNLPERFILYPSLMYQHKNHLRLLDALALARDTHNARIALVCTGAMGEFGETIRAHCAALHLESQTHFLDFIPAQDLKAIFRCATFLVFPSEFEGLGLGAVEALYEGLALVCSDIPPLREYADDAALYFDPHSAASIADAIARVWCDDTLCDDLARRSRVQSKTFSWQETARTFRALYRAVAGRTLSDQDQLLLARTQTAEHSAPTRESLHA